MAATLEDDAARRQQLMFQGNTLVAIHEQAGAEPYLDAVSFGPDSIATAFVDPTVAGREFDVDRDLPFLANGNNLVDDAPILDLDPTRLTHDDLSGNGVTFASGGTRGGPSVVLADIGGWEERQPGLALSSHEWYEQEGQAVEYRQVGRHVVAVPVRVDPDRSLAGTAAGSWADYEDRMWHIHRMFEQMHTSPELFDTRPIDDEIDNRYLTGAVPLDLTGR
ncbi:MAG TPA: hypothetical protein VKA65_11845 [Acidimicrobiales bacterium]|nr:hypothetical protein [Acidimicrobiales bacterium]